MSILLLNIDKKKLLKNLISRMSFGLEALGWFTKESLMEGTKW